MRNVSAFERNWKRISDFDDDERAVIAERAKYQTASELAEVFYTTPQTIAAISQKDKSNG